MYVDRFSGMFSAFNFTLVDGDISIKIKNSNIYNVKASVLSHRINSIVSFMRHLTRLNIV
jgi:hypothetical protein